MKKTTLAVPVLMTAAFASLVATGMSCSKSTPATGRTDGGSNAAPDTESSSVPATTTNTLSSTNGSNPNGSWNLNVKDTNSGENWAINVTSAPASGAAATDTNAPGVPATPEPAPTAPPDASNSIRTVEMPTNPPTPPDNFYPTEMAAKQKCFFEGNTNYFFRLRAGYEHIYHGDNNDTWYAGLKFYAYPDDLRRLAGKNGWLIPDADLEFSHQDLAKPDQKNSHGSAPGLNLRGSFTWPWFNWTTSALVRENCLCPYAQPLTFTFGPTVNLGFDYLFEDNDSRFARYAGARLTVNREAFVEYTAGATDGLQGTRQQALMELPFYVTRDERVRYVFRGLWNHGDSTPDVLEAGVFLEMPLDLVTHPREWGDLIPFAD